MNLADIDRSNLIREAYRIEGITEPECRSILVEWALKLPDGIAAPEAIRLLLDSYGTPGHPMTAVLTEGLAAPTASGRRGGRAARRS